VSAPETTLSNGCARSQKISQRAPRAKYLRFFSATKYRIYQLYLFAGRAGAPLSLSRHSAIAARRLVMSADSIMRVRALFLVASAAGFGSHPLCTCSAELAELETLRATMAAKDSEVAEKDAIIAELQATVASMTSPPPLPPPSAPLPAPPSPPPAPPRDEPCHTAFDLATLAEAEAWYAPHARRRKRNTRQTRQTHACAPPAELTPVWMPPGAAVHTGARRTAMAAPSR